MTSRHSFAARLRTMMRRGFAPYRRLSPGQVELSGMRVLQELRKDPMWESAAPVASETSAFLGRRSSQREGGRRKVMPLTVAASLVVAAVATAILWRPAGDALFTVVEGAVLQDAPSSLRRSFGATNTVRSNGGGGAVLALKDDSRIEMRSHSELSLERADDGIRVHLNEGGIIVNAAKQRSGHLYVQTKDMTVSVDGTVFVVNADAKGSRVAVVEGEVRVQQGATETKLRPGERVASSSKTEEFSIASELAWSRRAKELVATLERQSAAEQRPAAVAPQAPKEPRIAFEVVSIRSAAAAPPPGQGARGGGGGGLNSRPAPSGCVFDSFGYSLQLDPRRLAVTRTTLLHLVAYTLPGLRQEVGRRLDVNCDVLTKVGLLSGGPDWIRTDVWDVTATIPQGTFGTSPVLTDPVLQQMLRTMLTERFGLTIRRETREVPVYFLKVAADGPKFNGRNPALNNRNPDRGPVFVTRDADGNLVKGAAAAAAVQASGSVFVVGGFAFNATNYSMADLAGHLFGIDGRPVLDKTGLTGRYDFFYQDPAGRSRAAAGGVPAQGELDRALLKTIGLELEEARATFDAWVIEKAERPTEN